MEKSVVIAGVSVQTDTIDTVISRIISAKKPLRVEQINPEMIVQAHRGKHLDLLNEADIRVANGVGVLSKMQAKADQPLERFTSSSFTKQLLARAPKGWRVLIVGHPKKSSISATKKFLEAEFPQLVFETFDGETMDETKTASLIQQVSQHSYDLILLGLGFPIQSIVGKQLLGVLDHGIVIGEGGTFDYVEFGGTIRRAPQYIQKCKMEWLWRLVQEPTRLPRYTRLIQFLWISRKNT